MGEIVRSPTSIMKRQSCGRIKPGVASTPGNRRQISSTSPLGAADFVIPGFMMIERFNFRTPPHWVGPDGAASRFSDVVPGAEAAPGTIRSRPMRLIERSLRR